MSEENVGENQITEKKKRGRPENLKPFQKGNPGGPGRPKTRELDAMVREFLAQSVPSRNGGDKTLLEAIFAGLSAKAAKGDSKAAGLLLERGYGKAKQEIVLTGDGANPVAQTLTVKFVDATSLQREREEQELNQEAENDEE